MRSAGASTSPPYRGADRSISGGKGRRRWWCSPCAERKFSNDTYACKAMKPNLKHAVFTLAVVNSAAAQTTALTGGTVIDGTGRPAIANAVVVITGDRLSCVGTAAQCP